MTYHFNWKLTAFYLVFLPILLSLGVWQLDRGAEKRALLEQFEAMRNQPGVELGVALQHAGKQPDKKAVLRYTKVRLEGRFDNQRTFLLDNRINRGRIGYEVLAPFRLAKPVKENGQSIEWVWVNRGWLAAGKTRADLPPVPPVSGLTIIEGLLDPQLGKPLVLSETAFSGTWPEVVQRLDHAKMAGRLQLSDSMFAHQLRIDTANPAALDVIWQPVSMSPAKHTGYAVQWFAMAIALTFLYFYATVNRKSND